MAVSGCVRNGTIIQDIHFMSEYRPWRLIMQNLSFFKLFNEFISPQDAASLILLTKLLFYVRKSSKSVHGRLDVAHAYSPIDFHI